MGNTQQIIQQLSNTIGNFTGSVNAKVAEVQENTQRIKTTTDTTLAEIRQFKTTMIENEQMQCAQESVLRINQVIRERFYDYDTIRKTVLGVVKDFDINLVRNQTIEKLSEELWITSSKYWLSYTLIALSAWVNDNQELAGNAVSESCRADEVKTALFFCLTNLRFNRIDVARAWLAEYFNTVVPTDLQDEAAVMLQAYINGVFGVDEQLQYEVQSVVDEWIVSMNNDEKLSKELVEMYNKYIVNLRPNQPFNARYLAKYCLNYQSMPFAYNEALKYDILINKIKSVDVENFAQNAANYKKRIDLILKDLITNYDAEENELKEQQQYFQLIIDNKGKEDVAGQQFEQLMAVKHQKHNFGEKCVQWALYSNNDEINVHVQKFGIQSTKNWFLEALQNWSSNFEDKFQNTYKIKFFIREKDEWNVESNGEDMDEQINNLRNHIEENKKKIINDKKTKVRITLGVIFLILGVVAFIMFFPKELPLQAVAFVGVIFAVVGLILFIMGIVRFAKGKSRYKKIFNTAMDIMKGCMTEIVNYRKVYFENREKKGELFSLIEHL